MTAMAEYAAEDIDPVAVERACGGDHSVPLNRAEVAAAFRRLADRDYDNRQIADLLGVSLDACQLWRKGLRQPIALKAGRAMTTNHDDALYRADGIADRKIQNATSKARTALAALGALLDEWDRKAEARVEVERLEEELAAAKAKLRGGRPTPASNSGDAKAVRMWAKNNGVACPPMGRVPQAVVEKWKTATGK